MVAAMGSAISSYSTVTPLCYDEGVTDENQNVLREQSVAYEREELPPADVFDPVIEAYKKDVDRTLLREMLKLTPQQRSEKFANFMELAYEVRAAGERMRAEKQRE
jgi:hypothetical protein